MIPTTVTKLKQDILARLHRPLVGPGPQFEKHWGIKHHTMSGVEVGAAPAIIKSNIVLFWFLFCNLHKSLHFSKTVLGQNFCLTTKSAAWTETTKVFTDFITSSQYYFHFSTFSSIIKRILRNHSLNGLISCCYCWWIYKPNRLFDNN